MHDANIDIIIKSLEGLAATDDAEQAALFASSLSSVKASASRALIPNTRLGTLARFSVAASAAAPLKPYLDGSSRNRGRDRLMQDALLAALALVAEAEQRQREEPDVAGEAPEGWIHADGGSFHRETELGRAEIYHNPHMPGGDWTMSIGGVPVCYAASPSGNAELLEHYLGFLTRRDEDAAITRRRPLGFGTRRQA
jgi:hypothetical protein